MLIIIITQPQFYYVFKWLTVSVISLLIILCGKRKYTGKLHDRQKQFSFDIFTVKFCELRESNIYISPRTPYNMPLIFNEMLVPLSFCSRNDDISLQRTFWWKIRFFLLLQKGKWGITNSNKNGRGRHCYMYALKAVKKFFLPSL